MLVRPTKPSKRIRLFAWFASVCICATTLVFAKAAEPLPRSAPEQQGVASAAVSEFVAALDSEISHVHGLMVLRGGHVIAEGWWAPYRPEFIHLLFSLSKSFTSTAIGLAVDEGILSLDDKVVSFFPDQVPESPSWNLQNMRIRDLLSMSTGQHGEDLRAISFLSEDSLVEQFLHLPVAHKPGTHFHYNTAATYICSAILQEVTGENLLDYLRPRLLDPLGIGEATWGESSEGIAFGGFGLSVNTEAIARFAQLYLQQGTWEGRRLVSTDWVRAATSRQTSTGSDPNNDWDQGYGYQFWRSRHDSYRGDGAFGQFAMVLPEQDAVVAINSGTSQMADIMNIVWDHLLPAMGTDPLEENLEAHRALQAQLENLSIAIPSSSPDEGGRGQWLGRAWKFAENPLDIETLSLDEEGDESVLQVSTATGTHVIRSSSTRWVAGKTQLHLGASSLGTVAESQRIATSEVWTSDSAVSFRLAYTKAPLMSKISLHFSDEGVEVEVTHTATFGAQEVPKIVGVASDS